MLILQFFGLNVFHMWDNMAASSLGVFVSTIGNIDACATYYCMVLPVGMVLFFLSDELFSKVVYSIFDYGIFWGFCNYDRRMVIWRGCSVPCDFLVFPERP